MGDMADEYKRQKKYIVIPSERQPEPYMAPPHWKLIYANHATEVGKEEIDRFQDHRKAKAKANELAKEEGTTAIAYDAAKKSSDVEHYD